MIQLGPRDQEFFCREHLDDFLDKRGRKVAEAVGALSKAEVRSDDVESIVAPLVRRLQVEPVAVDWSNTEWTTADAEIDVSRDARYGRGFGGRPATAAGRAVTANVPFTGDADLFECRPNPFGMIPQRGLTTSPRFGGQRTLHMTRLVTRDEQHDAIVNDVRQMLGHIETNLSRANHQARIFNDSLPDRIRSAIESRRRKFDEDDDFGKGFPQPQRGDS